MGVGNREFWFLPIFVCLREVLLLVWFLGSCGDMWEASWMYTSGLGRMIMSHSVNLNTSHLVAGTYIFYFIYL
jgi:hypothetical protein